MGFKELSMSLLNRCLQKLRLHLFSYLPRIFLVFTSRIKTLHPPYNSAGTAPINEHTSDHTQTSTLSSPSVITQPPIVLSDDLPPNLPPHPHLLPPSRPRFRDLKSQRWSFNKASLILNLSSKDAHNEIPQTLPDNPEENHRTHSHDCWKAMLELEIFERVGKFYEQSSLINSYGPHDYKLNWESIPKNIFDFALLATPIGFNVRCKIVRREAGVLGSLCPTYFMFIQQAGEPDLFVLAAQRQLSIRKLHKTGYPFCSYIISTNFTEFHKDSEYCAGILKANFKRSKFDLVTTKDNVYDCFAVGDEVVFSIRPLSSLLMRVFCDNEDGRIGVRRPRRIRTAIPKLYSNFFRMHYIERKTNVHGDHLIQLENKKPFWSDCYRKKNGMYIIKFPAQVGEVYASEKNFVLTSEEPYTRSIHDNLYFFKISKNEFGLEFGNPFCPLQAFSIALARLDVK